MGEGGRPRWSVKQKVERESVATNLAGVDRL